MGDIALPNINYDNEWQQQRLNKTFQQELEQLKQEVYNEGLQVEEEGLTDIIRKKTKLPVESNPLTTHELPSKNDAVPAVRFKSQSISSFLPNAQYTYLINGPFSFSLDVIAVAVILFRTNNIGTEPIRTVHIRQKGFNRK